MNLGSLDCLLHEYRQRVYTKHHSSNPMSRFASIRTSSAGSYLGLYFSSCITTAIFLSIMTWHILSESVYNEIFLQNYSTHIYIVFVWVCLGWMMCLIAAIGFDLLPLIHGSAPFHENALRQFSITNLAGQVFLTISTFMPTSQRIEEFSTVGIAFLALSVLSLGGPGRRLYLESKRAGKEDEVGVFSLVPGLILPLLGMTVLACWLWRDVAGLLELGHSVIVMVFLLLTLVIIISHFNRRLNWNIINPEKIKNRATLFFILMALHVLFAFLAGRDDGGSAPLLMQMKYSTLGLSILGAFLLCNPLKVAKKALFGEKMAHNRLIFAALWMLPFCSFHAFNGSAYSEQPGIPGYNTLVATSILLALWGYSLYLHEDHLHINIHKRKSNMPFLLCFLVGFLAMQMFYLKVWFEFGTTTNEEIIYVFSTGICSVLTISNFLRQTLLSFNTWHRIPMFYGRYIQIESTE